jgi:hypothetical protein
LAVPSAQEMVNAFLVGGGVCDSPRKPKHIFSFGESEKHFPRIFLVRVKNKNEKIFTEKNARKKMLAELSL